MSLITIATIIALKLLHANVLAVICLKIKVIYLKIKPIYEMIKNIADFISSAITVYNLFKFIFKRKG